MTDKVIKVGDRFQFRCPGCDTIHELNTTWDFNGDYVSPTFRPSILVTGTAFPTDEEHERIMAGEPYAPTKIRCHSFITNGRIDFLNDCTHDLAGKVVALPDFN